VTVPTYWVLDDERRPVQVQSLVAWARWFQTADHHVAVTQVGDITVATVFLGIDHRVAGRGPPLLFETVCFSDGETVEGAPFRRYVSWDDAEAGHATAVRRVRELQKQRQGRK
jgi:hypothetical protein